VSSAHPDPALLERFADLIVGFGANVQPGQIVAVGSELGKEDLTRAIAASAYRRGARFVDVSYFDPHVKRARILYAPDDALEFIPSWFGERVVALGEQRCARVSLSGPAAPGLLDDLDPVRAGRDRFPWIPEVGQVTSDRTTNWTVAPCPTPAWAELVHPDLEPELALARLWEEIVHVCRLDAADPAAAWRERVVAISAAARRLTERRFDALHFEGPGTDLRVGLMASSRWMSADFETVDGIPHMPNLPSEEVFTTPDPERVDGVVRATKPLTLLGGTIVRGLSVRFEGGRAIQLDGDAGVETLRALCEADPGGSRLGEVALVDRQGRIGPLGTVFYDTLLDENASSHVAFGRAYSFAVGEEDHDRANDSAIHIDFMIGGDDVDVTGLTAAGERVPVLRGGDWQI